jgi:hypothetical protein
VLRSKPHLRSCLARCRHCRIFFLTDPRNRGRRDLGCPFGCRDAERRRRSTERSTAYNRSRAGRLKKKIRNGTRSSRGQPDPAPAEAPREESTKRDPEASEFAAGLIEYLAVAVSLIEGRRVSREEIVEVLHRAMRQRSFARERRIDYVVRTLKEKPP